MKYEILSYIGSLTSVVLMLVINHLGLQSAWFIPTPTELQTVVNEPIYDSNSYFISSI